MQKNSVIWISPFSDEWYLLYGFLGQNCLQSDLNRHPANLAKSSVIRVGILIIFFKNTCRFPLWQYGLWSFQAGGTKLERFLAKNPKGNY